VLSAAAPLVDEVSGDHDRQDRARELPSSSSSVSSTNAVTRTSVTRARVPMARVVRNHARRLSDDG
jgi:hypothetical protein